MDWCYTELVSLFSHFHDEDVLQRIRCLGRWQSSEEQQVQSLSSFLNLLTCTAAERSWYMLHFTFTFPEQWCGLLADGRAGLDAMDEFVEICKTIILAEHALRDPDHRDRVAPWS